MSKDDQALLLDSLRQWGALDKNYAYVAGPKRSNRRGYDKPPGGGLSARPVLSQPLQLHDVLNSHLWTSLTEGDNYEFQTTLFQPVGGMGRIGDAFGPRAGRIDPLQRKSHCHPARRTRRHRHLRRHASSRQHAESARGLVHLYDSAFHSQPDSRSTLARRWPMRSLPCLMRPR